MSLGDYIDKYMMPPSPAMSQIAVGASNDDEDDEDDDEARGYLAQHPLFDQVPSLRDDIAEPSLCAAVCPEDLAAPANCEVRLSKKTAPAALAANGKAATNGNSTATSNKKKAGSKEEESLGPLVSAWFGPSGTVSPLHNDPYHNLLCQARDYYGCCYMKSRQKCEAD